MADFQSHGVSPQLTAEATAYQLGVQPSSLIWTDPGAAADMIIKNLARERETRKIFSKKAPPAQNVRNRTTGSAVVGAAPKHIGR